MKPKRNDLCPCGSGKKYKKCCLQTQPSAQDLSWQRQHRINQSLPAKLLKFAANHFGEEALVCARNDYYDSDDNDFDFDHPEDQLFLPWYLFQWQYDSSGIDDSSSDGQTIGELFLRQNRNIDRNERQYLQAVLESCLSFHDVIECEPGRGFLLRDVFTLEEKQVLERSASRPAQKGDIVFALVVKFEDIYVLEGCAPLLVPPRYKKTLIDLRKTIRRAGMPITPDMLKDFDIEMIDIFHDIAQDLLDPPKPVLQNTNGDPLCFYKLIYRISSPQATFDALQALRLDITDAEQLSNARYSKNGKLVAVEFPWLVKGNKLHKHWDNTVLGHIFIDGDTLTAEVNSKRRADKIKRLIKKFAPKASYQSTVIEDMEQKLSTKNNMASNRDDFFHDDDHELADLPAVRAEVASLLQNHWDAWLREKIPALGNQTPVQAVKNPDGRELVEALLLDFERQSRQEDELTVPPVDWLREKLGLAEQT